MTHPPLSQEVARQALNALTVVSFNLSTRSEAGEPTFMAQVRAAISSLSAALADKEEPDTRELLKSIRELTGEANTLAGILSDAYKVLLTVDGENDDEEQMLNDLRTAIVYALDPYKREGTLL